MAEMPLGLQENGFELVQTALRRARGLLQEFLIPSLVPGQPVAAGCSGPDVAWRRGGQN